MLSMARNKKEVVAKSKLGGRSLALTIILGVFLAIMVATFVNLLVGYVYESPQYDKYCNVTNQFNTAYPAKIYPGAVCSGNCTFNAVLDNEAQACSNGGGSPFYQYDSSGCAVSLKGCDMCSKNWEEANKVYNRNTFFVYALIGFILIALGLFIPTLLLQIITLPAGAFLVIEAAVKNFDNKLYVIITFGLLIVAAIYLALKKLK